MENALETLSKKDLIALVDQQRQAMAQVRKEKELAPESITQLEREYTQKYPFLNIKLLNITKCSLVKKENVLKRPMKFS